jgi:hypothetical protein
MTSTIAQDTATDLAIYLAAKHTLDGIPVGTRLTERQAWAQQVVSAFTPDCPDDQEEMVHNISVISEPYTRNGRTYVWRRCTCGLAEGAEYPA